MDLLRIMNVRKASGYRLVSLKYPIPLVYYKYYKILLRFSLYYSGEVNLNVTRCLQIYQLITLMVQS